jgi:hypothetical protein
MNMRVKPAKSQTPRANKQTSKQDILTCAEFEEMTSIGWEELGGKGDPKHTSTATAVDNTIG